MDKEHKKATEFANSMRGQYIIAKALRIAAEKLDDYDTVETREKSDASDMRYILDNLFQQWKGVLEVEEMAREMANGQS